MEKTFRISLQVWFCKSNKRKVKFFWGGAKIIFYLYYICSPLRSDAQCDPLTYVGCVDDPGDISTYACISIPINQTRPISELYDPANPNAPLLEPADAVNIPQRVLINGRIEFNEDYTFAAGSEIVFLSYQSGFDITDSAVLNLKETHVHGCQILWDGIDLYGAGATLNIGPGSIFEDGNQTIRMRHGTTLSVRDAFFRMNRVCISARPVPGDPETINVNTFITGTVFDGSEPLVQEIIFGGKTYQYPFRAILVNDITQINLGIPETTPVNSVNTFSGYTQAPESEVAAAIHSYNTNLTVRNTRIINPAATMEDDIAFCGIKAGAAQDKIRTLDFVGLGRDNPIATFEKVFTGIDCANMNVYLSETNFQVGFKHLMLGSYSLPARFEILRNRFSAYWKIGMDMSNTVFPAKHFNVAYNIFEDSEAMAFGTERSAINAAAAPIAKSNLFIRDNQFFNYEKPGPLFYAPSGIQFFGVSGAVIENNDFFNNFSANSVYRGIYLRFNSRGCVIEGNHFTGLPNFSTHLFSRGIYASHSQEITYKCNEFDMLSRGIYIEGNCDASNLISNFFNSHIRGLHLDSTARIGAQPYKQNRWLATTSSPRLEAAFDVSPLDPQYFIKLGFSKFFIAEEENSTYEDRWPIPRTPGGNTWFAHNSEGTLPYLPCYESAPENPTLTEADERVIVASFPPLDGFEASVWDATLGAYSRLYRFPDLRPMGSDAATFYVTTQNTAAGLLAAAYEQTGEITAPGALLSQELEIKYDSMRQIMLDIVEVDSLLMIVPAGQQAALLTIRNSLTQMLSGLNSTTDVLLSGFAAQRKTEAQNLAAGVAAVAVSETYQQNLKTVVGIILEGMQAEPIYEWTSQQSEALETIAGQCLPQGGFGVLLARNLLPPAEYADNCIEERNPEPGTNGQPAAVSFRAYPNPATDLLVVRYSFAGEGSEVILEDQLGRIVIKRPLEASETTIYLNIGHIPNGAYLVRINSRTRSPLAQKIFIQH